MTSIKITPLEQDVLTGIYASEYSDGGPQPEPWAWAIRNKIATKAQIPGVVSSLQKKGIVKCIGTGGESAARHGEGASIRVTEVGEQVARAYGIYTDEEAS